MSLDEEDFFVHTVFMTLYLRGTGWTEGQTVGQYIYIYMYIEWPKIHLAERRGVCKQIIRQRKTCLHTAFLSVN